MDGQGLKDAMRPDAVHQSSKGLRDEEAARLLWAWADGVYREFSLRFSNRMTGKPCHQSSWTG